MSVNRTYTERRDFRVHRTIDLAVGITIDLYDSFDSHSLQDRSGMVK